MNQCFFGAQKGAFKAKYQPLLWGIFHDIYKLAWPDPFSIQKKIGNEHKNIIKFLKNPII